MRPMAAGPRAGRLGARLGARPPLLPLLLLLAAPCSSLRTAAGSTPRAPDRRARLAVIVCGLQDRFLFHSKVAHVVAPAVQEGHSVDVYVDVVASGAQDNKDSFTRVTGQVKSFDAGVENLASALDASVSEAGGRLAYFLVRAAPEDLHLPNGQAARKRLPHRLAKYPPLSDPIGRNLLRRYQTAERLMSRIMATGKQYDFVLWTRDDDHWLGPLDLDSFLADEGSAWRLYSKGCLTWDGVNDKTLLFGGRAAEAMLGRLYSDFWLEDKRLEGAKNAESFLKAFAEVKGVETVPVPFGRLPTADSVYAPPTKGGAPRLCQKDRYLCSGLPLGPSFETPVPCGMPSLPTARPSAQPEPAAAQGPGAASVKTALTVVNYWSYPDADRRHLRGEALKRTLQALLIYPVRMRVLLVTNEWAPEAEGLVEQQIVRPVQRCSPSFTDPLCMAWEAMRVLRNESTGGQPGCDLWHNGACGEPRYDYYMYLEGDIEMPSSTFEFWAKHVDGLFRQAYILVPHREEPFAGQQKLTECVRNHLVDHLAQTKALRDVKGGADLYKDDLERVYLQPPVPYSACLLLSRWQFEVYRQGSAWDYERVARTTAGGKVREAAIKGLLADPRLAKLKAVTHVNLPVLHQQQMSGNVGLYPDMCKVEDYRAKAASCSSRRGACAEL